MGKYFIKDGYKENLDNLYYDDNPSDNITWQPDVYRYAIAYAKKHKIKNIIDIGSGNGDKLYDYRDEFNITFIDFGANLDIIKEKFSSSKGDHAYIDQDFEQSFPDLPMKTIKNSIIICSDVIEHIRDMKNLCTALVNYSKVTRMLVVSTPDRDRLYGYDHDGIPNNLCHVREWKLQELDAYFRSAGMDFLIGLTRSNDRQSRRSTLYVLSGKDFLNKKDKTVYKKYDPNILTKFITKDELIQLFKEKKIKAPKFEDGFCGLYNPYVGNYMVNHFIAAVASNSTYSVNKFKFINQETHENSLYSPNIDCNLLQFLGSTGGDYPISFTFLYDGNTLSDNNDEKLLTVSAQQLATQYLPEMILSFNLLDKDAEQLARLPNYSNIQNELASHMGIKRSTRLLAGNIKRRVMLGKNR